MQAPGPGPALRPLGLGEVLDRAVTLCVRFFAPLATIYVIYAIPLAFVTYFSTRNLQLMITAMTDAMRHQGPGSPFDAQAINRAMLSSSDPSTTIWSVVALIASIFLAPLPTAALIEATTAFYLGRSSSFSQAYRVALDRYWNILGINVLFGVCAFAIYIVLVLVILFVIFGLAFVTTTLHGVGIAIDVVVGIIVVCAAFAIGIVAVLALQIAYFTCVVERANFSSSFVRALKRTFTGIGLKRSLLVGLVYLAIGIGILIVTMVGQVVLLGILHSAVIGTIYETIVRVATAAFTTAFIGIFYLDLRVREEGLDLAIAADRANAGPAAPAW